MQRGFSILELLVVMALIAICLTITMPVLANMETRYSVKSATSTLTLDLLAMRYRAVSENAGYRLRVDAPNAYVIEKKTSGEWIERRRRVFNERVTIETNNDPVFTRDGSVTSMSTTYVGCYGRRYSKVSIAITGRVKVEKLN